MKGRKFRKKPVVIEAVQWTGTNLDEVLAFVGTGASLLRKDHVTSIGSVIPGGSLMIQTLEGEHVASPGDWIIKGEGKSFTPASRTFSKQLTKARTRNNE